MPCEIVPPRFHHVGLSVLCISSQRARKMIDASFSSGSDGTERRSLTTRTCSAFSRLIFAIRFFLSKRTSTTGTSKIVCSPYGSPGSWLLNYTICHIFKG
ncbi:unnamed protein product [Amoebophrya sp. A120]|nr:unnamed protein product [Amoebophrya sp. A120]|eukprot:GSA120T00020766001.1